MALGIAVVGEVVADVLHEAEAARCGLPILGVGASIWGLGSCLRKRGQSSSAHGTFQLGGLGLWGGGLGLRSLGAEALLRITSKAASVIADTASKPFP